MKHAAYTELYGIDNYIPFEEYTTADLLYGVSSVWRRMYHYFNLNLPFIQHYMKQSNVERFSTC